MVDSEKQNSDSSVNTTNIDSGGSNTETGRVKLSGVQDHGSSAQIVGGRH